MANRFSPIIILSAVLFLIALSLTVYAGVPIKNAVIWNMLSSLDIIYYTLPVAYVSNTLIFFASVLDVFVFVLLAVWLASGVFSFVREINIRGKITVRKIARLEGHVIVTPYNQFAKDLIEGLKKAGHKFVVITEKENVAENLIREGILSTMNEPDSIDTFYDAGIKKAKSVVICAESDSQNIMIGIAAKSANKEIHIISRLGNRVNATHMDMVGIYKTVSPEDAAGEELAEEVIRKIV